MSKKYVLLTSILCLVLASLAAPFQEAHAATGKTSIVTNCIANPNVEYPSIALAERRVGFPVLSIQPKANYTLQRVNVIADKIVELTYTDDKQKELVIRTAKFTGDNQNISGIYGAKWRDENIGCLYMHLTQTADSLSGAYWNDQNYTYAVIGKGFSEREFFTKAAGLYMSINLEP